MSPDALVCSGSRTSSRSYNSLYGVLAFGLGARRSCSGNAGRPRLKIACAVGFLLLLHRVRLHIILDSRDTYMVCRLVTCDRVIAKELNVFHAKEHNQLSWCHISKDTSPGLWKDALLLSCSVVRNVSQAPDQELGFPGLQHSLSLCLKERTQVLPCFPLKGLHYHPSSHQRCAYLHQYQPQTS